MDNKIVPDKNFPASFASCSIGCKPEHTLPKKLDAIARAGFQGIELSMPDLLSFACESLKREIKPDDYDNLAHTATQVRAMCDAKGLEIMLMQPFANYEGWLDRSQERVDVMKRVEGWIKIMEAAGIKTLQVGSIFSIY